MKVEVLDHNDQWREMYRKESQQIKHIFGEELIDIYHIGSTSVTGLKAKPIIDIMPVVKDIKNVDSFNNQMIEIGYEPLGEFGMEGRRYFRKGKTKRTHQIHVFQIDNNKDINRHLAFRDYLRTHVKAANQYGNLKAKLAKSFPNDIESYMDGKDKFIKDLQGRAIEWYKLLKK